MSTGSTGPTGTSNPGPLGSTGPVGVQGPIGGSLTRSAASYSLSFTSTPISLSIDLDNKFLVSPASSDRLSYQNTFASSTPNSGTFEIIDHIEVGLLIRYSYPPTASVTMISGAVSLSFRYTPALSSGVNVITFGIAYIVDNGSDILYRVKFPMHEINFEGKDSPSNNISLTLPFSLSSSQGGNISPIIFVPFVRRVNGSGSGLLELWGLAMSVSSY